MFPHANILDLYHGDNREQVPDFTALRHANILACIHKASQGINYKDDTYAARRAAAEKAGMLFGAYHFLDSSDATKQAEHFLTCCDWKNGAPLALVVDYEKSRNLPSLSQLLTFMSVVDQETDHSCICYSGDLIRETLRPNVGGHIAQDMIGHEDFFRKHRLWLAEYGPHENIPWPWNASLQKDDAPGVWLWQFSATGREPPIVGAVDLNFFDGTEDELRAKWIK